MNGRLTRTPHDRAARLANPALLGVLLGALLGMGGLGACRTTPPGSPGSSGAPLPRASTVSPTSVAARSSRVPEWIGEPLSWSKLTQIETWLATEGHAADPFWRIEGELALNRGRVELSRQDGGAKADGDAGVRRRVLTARAGFQRVAGDADATPGQKQRANALIAGCDKLLGTAKAVATPAVALIPRTQWGAKNANASRMDRNRGGWRRITIHHSAERRPPDLDGSLAASAAAVRSIQTAHMDGAETGYGDIGYHFVVDPYGRVFQGRDLAWQGAHAAGANNVQNIGVCLIGNFDEERPTKEALESLRELVESLRASWKIPKSQVLMHQELKKTECPGRNLAAWVESYRRGGAAAVAASSGPVK